MCPTWFPGVPGLLLGNFALSYLLQLINIQPHESSSARLSFNHGIVSTPKSNDTDSQKFLNIVLCWQEWEAALASLGLQEELKIGDSKPRWGSETILRCKEKPGVLKGTVPPVACWRGYQQISREIRKGKKTAIPFLVLCFQSCWIPLKRTESSQVLGYQGYWERWPLRDPKRMIYHFSSSLMRGWGNLHIRSQRFQDL